MAVRPGLEPESACRAGLVDTPVIAEADTASRTLGAVGTEPCMPCQPCCGWNSAFSVAYLCSQREHGGVLGGRGVHLIGCAQIMYLFFQLQGKLGKQVFGIFTVIVGGEYCLIRLGNSICIETGLRCRWTKRVTSV